MGTTTIIVTLALLLDFFKSKLHNKYPKITEFCYDLAYSSKNNRPGEKNNVKTVLGEYLQINYAECVQPSLPSLGNWTRKLMKTGKCSFDLD